MEGRRSLGASENQEGILHSGKAELTDGARGEIPRRRRRVGIGSFFLAFSRAWAGSRGKTDSCLAFLPHEGVIRKGCPGHIWKARNAMIFDHIDSAPRDIIRRVVQDIDAWSCRFNQLKPDLLVSKTWLQSCY